MIRLFLVSRFPSTDKSEEKIIWAPVFIICAPSLFWFCPCSSFCSLLCPHKRAVADSSLCSWQVAALSWQHPRSWLLEGRKLLKTPITREQFPLIYFGFHINYYWMLLKDHLHFGDKSERISFQLRIRIHLRQKKSNTKKKSEYVYLFSVDISWWIYSFCYIVCKASFILYVIQLSSPLLLHLS